MIVSNVSGCLTASCCLASSKLSTVLSGFDAQNWLLVPGTTSKYPDYLLVLLTY